jgi:hypothetical protein
MDGNSESTAPIKKPDPPRKRRFQFGLRTLLLLITGTAAVLSWWITWPQRSATRLINLMAILPDKAAETYRLGGMGSVMRKYKHDAPYLEPHSRSALEILKGTQTFTVVLPTYDVHKDGQEIDYTATLFATRGNLKGPIELDSRPKRRRK